jgi:hypothetical protein
VALAADERSHGRAHHLSQAHGHQRGELARHQATRTSATSQQSHLGWQPSRFLTDHGEAERAFQLAEQLGSVNAAASQLGTTWPSLPSSEESSFNHRSQVPSDPRSLSREGRGGGIRTQRRAASPSEVVTVKGL